MVIDFVVMVLWMFVRFVGVSCCYVCDNFFLVFFMICKVDFVVVFVCVIIKEDVVCVVGVLYIMVLWVINMLEKVFFVMCEWVEFFISSMGYIFNMLVGGLVLWCMCIVVVIVLIISYLIFVEIVCGLFE